MRKQNGTSQRKNTITYIYALQSSIEKVPDLKYLLDKGIDLNSHPSDCFNLFFPRHKNNHTHPKAVEVDELTPWKNTKAIIVNAVKRGGR